MEKDFITIAKMCHLCGTTRKTLKHYHKIGLFVPAYIDDETNYRYYAKEQIYSFLMIQKMQFLGFSLKEIKKLIIPGKFNELEKLILKKNDEVNKKIEDLKKVSNGFKKSLEIIDEIKSYKLADKINFSPEIKIIPDRTVLSIRGVIPFNFAEVGKRWKELFRLANKHNLKYNHEIMDIFHENYANFDISSADIEHCIGVSSPTNKNNNYTKLICGGQYATIRYFGTYYNSIENYLILKKWIEKNNLLIMGPVIRNFLLNFSVNSTLDTQVSEIQIKVKKYID